MFLLRTAASSLRPLASSMVASASASARAAESSSRLNVFFRPLHSTCAILQRDEPLFGMGHESGRGQDGDRDGDGDGDEGQQHSSTPFRGMRDEPRFQSRDFNEDGDVAPWESAVRSNRSFGDNLVDKEWKEGDLDDYSADVYKPSESSSNRTSDEVRIFRDRGHKVA
jgi:hypothetical protein